ncbi:MAG: hypothetical protein KIT84_36725 [Labilithrix sp.]|nr:hypothetical protein [Labilithrix sp.]MCW5816601.1 hypothetical protein [Labilithrix sp.]
MSDAEHEIAAALCLARLLPPEEAGRVAGPWIVATMTERVELPPAGVVADVGALLFGATLDRLRPAADDPALAAAIRRYEDALLGRLASDRRLVAAGFAALRLPPRMHGQAVGILVAGILARIGVTGGFTASPAVVRRLAERSPEQTVAAGHALLRDDPTLRATLADWYADAARRAQRARELVGEADIFALENLTVLAGLAQRLAAADVVRAEEAIARGVPRRVRRRRKKEGDVAAKLEDESAYPAGGFASMSTSGSIENLVTSELIYMTPPAEARSGEIDLFDMRWVEGELLYYTRDEAIFVRRRRVVFLALDHALVRARVKDAHVPFQRIVLVLAVVLVVVKKLVELLGEEALELRVVFLDEELAEERVLTELLLREWIERGICEVSSSTWPKVVASSAAETRRALVEVVSLGGGAPELDARIVDVPFPLPAGTLDDWSRATTEALSGLV